jgi:hypothetical protein
MLFVSDGIELIQRYLISKALEGFGDLKIGGEVTHTIK